MKRLHSTYSSGWAGAGLLLLRVAVGMTLIMQAAGFLLELQDARLVTPVLCILALAGGASLVLGFLTPIGGALAVLSGLGITLVSPSTSNGNFFSGNPLTVDFLAMALAVALLGPGAFSLDAHLFGRRKIIIPRATYSNPSLFPASRPQTSAHSPSKSLSHTEPSSSRPPQS